MIKEAIFGRERHFEYGREHPIAEIFIHLAGASGQRFILLGLNLGSLAPAFFPGCSKLNETLLTPEA
jgi:hypothetical protein